MIADEVANERLARWRDWVLSEAAWPDLPFADPARRTRLDYLARAAEVAYARLRGLNPPPPPWRRRSVTGWHLIGPGPGPSQPTERPLLFGLIAAWNEEDVIYATVRNLFAQGCDRVLLIDDDSDDDTAQEAAAAGAHVVHRSSDGIYREAARSASIAQVMASETQSAGGDVWWVITDADEFPRGNDGRTIRDTVASLPGWVDVVGSLVVEHLPHPGATYEPRTDPVAAFPRAHEYRNPYCRLGHWKHQLIRARDSQDVVPMPGQHTVGHQDGRRSREWPHPILMHHVPLRGHERTLAKLRQAVQPGGRYTRTPDTFTRWRVQQRMRALDLLYEGRYDEVPNGFPGLPATGIKVTDWR